MARKFATNLDLATNELLNSVIQVLAAAPSNKEGRFYYDSVKKSIGWYNGTIWKYANEASGPSEAEVLTLIQEKLNGLSWKQPAALATTAALAANAQSGSEATAKLTANAVGVQTIDGVTAKAGMRILVKNEATGSHNGIYEVTTEGTAGVKYVLTRTADAAKGAQMADATLRVEKGTVNKESTWTLETEPPVTVDTTALAFVEIESALALKGDNVYITKSTNTFEPVFNATAPTEPASENEVNAGVLSAVRKYTTAFRTKSATNSYTVTHKLNTENLIVQATETSAKKPTVPIEVDWEVSGLEKIVIKFPEAPANTMYDLVVLG